VGTGNGNRSFEELVIARFEEHDKRFDRVHQQVAELTGKLIEAMDRGFSELRAEIVKTNNRLDELIVNSGGHWRDLERRVTAIEERLDPE
jgi:hypothetical protein